MCAHQGTARRVRDGGDAHFVAEARVLAEECVLDRELELRGRRLGDEARRPAPAGVEPSDAPAVNEDDEPLGLGHRLRSLRSREQRDARAARRAPRT